MSTPILRRLVVMGLVLVGLLDAGLAAAQNPPEAVEYYATDALGSVRVVFTPTGQVVGRSAYLPFGDTLDQSGALPRQRFTGQERDGEAGLDYFNARSLQMRTGRMNRPDPEFGNPLTSPQRWNPYAYVDNNPLGLVDPTGLSPSGKDGQFFAYDNQTWATDLPGLSPGYSPLDASNRSMGAATWTDLAQDALTPKALPNTSYVASASAPSPSTFALGVVTLIGLALPAPTTPSASPDITATLTELAKILAGPGAVWNRTTGDVPYKPEYDVENNPYWMCPSGKVCQCDGIYDNRGTPYKIPNGTMAIVQPGGDVIAFPTSPFGAVDLIHGGVLASPPSNAGWPVVPPGASPIPPIVRGKKK
jgi:RHS repeat-associated protein